MFRAEDCLGSSNAGGVRIVVGISEEDDRCVFGDRVVRVVEELVERRLRVCAYGWILIEDLGAREDRPKRIVHFALGRESPDKLWTTAKHRCVRNRFGGFRSQSLLSNEVLNEFVRCFMVLGHDQALDGSRQDLCGFVGPPTRLGSLPESHERFGGLADLIAGNLSTFAASYVGLEPRDHAR